MAKSPIFNQMSRFPLYCSYMFVDIATDNAILQFSNGNGVNHLADNVTLLRRGIFEDKLIQNAFNRHSLDVIILKEYKKAVDPIIMKAEAVIEFNKTRFTDVTGRFSKREYKLHKSVLSDYTVINNKTPLVYITLKTKAVKAIVVAIFDTMLEADEWIGINYPGSIQRLIFCDNKLTRDYRKLYGYRLIR